MQLHTIILKGFDLNQKINPVRLDTGSYELTSAYAGLADFTAPIIHQVLAIAINHILMLGLKILSICYKIVV